PGPRMFPPGMLGGSESSSNFPVALAPDGKTLVATRGTSVILWDVASGKELRRLAGVPHVVSALGFAEGGKQVVLAAAESLFVWETATGKRLKGRDGPDIAGGRILSFSAEMVFSPDGKLLARPQVVRAVGGGFTVKLTEVATGKALPEITLKEGAAFA